MKRRNNRRAASLMTAFIIFVGSIVSLPSYVFAEDYIRPNSEALSEDRTYIREKYYPQMTYDSRISGNVSVQKLPAVLKYAEAVWFDEPKVEGCAYCQSAANSSYYGARIWIEKSNGQVVAGSGYQLADIGNQDFDTGMICLEIVHKPGDYCNYCGRRLGEVVTVEGLTIKKRLITYIRQPVSQTTNAGGTVQFEVVAKYDGPYKWLRNDDGEWKELNEGYGVAGEKYTGTNSNRLTIQNDMRHLIG